MDVNKLSPAETEPLVARPNDYGGISNDVEAARPEAKQYKTFREIAFICIGLWTAVFCSALSGTVVSNLQISIASYFRAASLSAWIGSAYLLGLAAMTPLYGRLCEILGRRTTMIVATFLFLLGTSLCAVAPSMSALIFARGIAGSGAGGLLTVTAIIVSDLVSLADRGLYQGGVNVLFGFGAAIGAVAGGFVGDRLGWRYAFGLQIPFILLSLSLIIWKVHIPMPKSDRTAREKLARVDWTGTLTLVTCITSFMVASSLVTSSHWPITSKTVIVLGVTAIFFVPLFILAEKRAVEPIMPLSILTKRSPAFILFGFLLLTSTNFARIFYLPVYLHVVRGLNGSETGLLLLPTSIVGSAASLYAGYYMRKYKRYKTFSVIMSVIPVLQGFSIIFLWDRHTSRTELWMEMALGALGGGAIITSMLSALIASVDKTQVSLAISACYLFRSIGQVLGVSISSAIQQQALRSSLVSRLGDYSGPLIRAIINEPTSVLPTLETAVRIQAETAYLQSIRAVFVFAIIGGALLTGCCIGMTAYPLNS